MRRTTTACQPLHCVGLSVLQLGSTLRKSPACRQAKPLEEAQRERREADPIFSDLTSLPCMSTYALASWGPDDFMSSLPQLPAQW